MTPAIDARRCFAHACGAEIPVNKLLCLPHWTLVPEALRERFYHAEKARRKPGGEKKWYEMARSIREAIDIEARKLAART